MEGVDHFDAKVMGSRCFAERLQMLRLSRVRSLNPTLRPHPYDAEPNNRIFFKELEVSFSQNPKP